MLKLKFKYMSSSLFAAIWSAGIIITVGIYFLAVTGRLYCGALFLGHFWATLKEEVARPIRVIKKALKRDITLDEHEQRISG